MAGKCNYVAPFSWNCFKGQKKTKPISQGDRTPKKGWPKKRTQHKEGR